MFIKKTLGLLVSSVICFTGLSNAAIVFDNGKVSANTDGLSSYSNAVLGDIDNNGKINSIDLSMARKGMIEGFQTNYARKSFDVDGDTQASISDLFLLKKYNLGVITEFPAQSIIPYDIYYAIDAYYENAIIESYNTGYTGEAYINPDNMIGSFIEWTVNVDTAGKYRLTFAYANGSTETRPTAIAINGVEVLSRLQFPITSWTDWSEVSIVVELNAGDNKIRATGITEYGGANIDFLKVEESLNDDLTEDGPSENAKQVEDLNRGLVAANAGNGMLLSWRSLGTDSANTTFKLFRNGALIHECAANDATTFFDTSGTVTDYYTVDTFVNGNMTEWAIPAIVCGTKNSGQSGAYFDIPIQKPAGGTTPDGVAYTYSPNDASVADLDGDGEYEIILKWDPSNSQDNSKGGYTGNVYIDAYKMNGTRLWRIDLGKNIRAGAHYTQFMVYDFDGDGYAEMVCKTADGTVDGEGNIIGDGSKDYRNSSGYILSGPEYLTLFDGRTGKAIDTINYEPARGNVADWGDSYGNRVDRFLAGVAYLDGKTPSVIMCRGYYTRTAIVAYNVINNKLVKQWIFDTGFDSRNPYYGQGNHSLAVADVDGDGCDEIIYGSCVINNDGTGLHSTGLGHGDMLQVGNLVPSRPGMEIWQVHESAVANYGASLRDARTGEIIFKKDAGGDTGRGIAANFRADVDGMEFTSTADGVLYNYKGESVGNWSDITKWGMNSIVWWTGELERAALDRTMVDQYGMGRVFTGDGVTYNNGSKSNACITADIFGDWREELIFPTSDGNALRVFTTTFDTEYKITTLMHDTQYRCGVAIQNVAYNQAPNTSFFLGTGYDLPSKPDVYPAKVN